MAVNKEVKGMFGGLKSSRQAFDLVRTALDKGVNPQSYINDAVRRTQESGRTKVYVRPDGPLATLRGNLASSGVVFSFKSLRK